MDESNDAMKGGTIEGRSIIIFFDGRLLRTEKGMDSINLGLQYPRVKFCRSLSFYDALVADLKHVFFQVSA